MTNWIKRAWAAFVRWNTAPQKCSACRKHPAEVNDPWGGAYCRHCGEDWL